MFPLLMKMPSAPVNQKCSLVFLSAVLSAILAQMRASVWWMDRGCEKNWCVEGRLQGV